MRMRYGISLLAAVAFVALGLNVTGCAPRQYRNAGEAARVGKGGVVVLVDSSVRVAVSGETDAVSIPENVQIALDMVDAAEAGLATKGYALKGGSLFSVGGSFSASEKVIVRSPSGSLRSPGEVGKPFIVRPEPPDPATSAKMNELFVWSRKAGGSAPASALDIARSPGLLLVSCRGGNASPLPAGSGSGISVRSFKPGAGPEADAWSEISILLIDGSTGKPVWLDRGAVTAFTPEAAAKEVERLVGQLPAAK